ALPILACRRQEGVKYAVLAELYPDLAAPAGCWALIDSDRVAALLVGFIPERGKVLIKIVAQHRDGSVDHHALQRIVEQGFLFLLGRELVHGRFWQVALDHTITGSVLLLCTIGLRRIALSGIALSGIALSGGVLCLSQC